MPKVKVGDINIYYEIYGNGFPLVMLRGLSSSLDSWSPFTIKRLSEMFKVIIFDNRGAGRTEPVPKGKYSAKMMAGDTIGLMDSIKIEKAYLLGYSLGGCIAQEAVLNYPHRVDKLILTSSWCGLPHGIVTPDPEKNPFPKMLPFMKVRDFEKMARILTNALFPEDYKAANPDIIEKVVENYMVHPPIPKGFEGQAAYVESFNTYDSLIDIKIPTLILHGTEDLILPAENAKILAERIPFSELVLFENTGHGMLIQEKELFTQKVINFLNIF